MAFGIFEAAVSSEAEVGLARQASVDAMNAAIYDVRAKLGPSLFASTSLEQFRDRVAMMKTDQSVYKIISAHIHPGASVVRRIIGRGGVMEKEFKARLASDVVNPGNPNAPADPFTPAAQSIAHDATGTPNPTAAEVQRSADSTSQAQTGTGNRGLPALPGSGATSTNPVGGALHPPGSMPGAPGIPNLPSLPGQKASRRRRAAEDDPHRETLDTDETFKPQKSRPELKPKGDFKGYLNGVDQDARSKVDGNCFTGEGTEHDMDPAKHNFASRRRADLSQGVGAGSAGATPEMPSISGPGMGMAGAGGNVGVGDLPGSGNTVGLAGGDQGTTSTGLNNAMPNPTTQATAAREMFAVYRDWCVANNRSAARLSSLDAYADRLPDGDYMRLAAFIQASAYTDRHFGPGMDPEESKRNHKPKVPSTKLKKKDKVAAGAHAMDVEWAPPAGYVGDHRKELSNPHDEGILHKLEQGAPDTNAWIDFGKHEGAMGRYTRWAKRNGLKALSARNIAYYAQNDPEMAYVLAYRARTALRTAAWRRGRQGRHLVAGPDYLQKADDALTQLLNTKAEEFQQTIAPLQQALVTVQQAEQLQQAQNPLNVLPPPGTVNVMPGGDQGPAGMPAPGAQDLGAAVQALAGGGGAPPGAAGLGASPGGGTPDDQGGPPPAAAGGGLPPGLDQQTTASHRRRANSVHDLWSRYQQQHAQENLGVGGDADYQDFASQFGIGQRALDKLKQHHQTGVTPTASRRHADDYGSPGSLDWDPDRHQVDRERYPDEKTPIAPGRRGSGKGQGAVRPRQGGRKTAWPGKKQQPAAQPPPSGGGGGLDALSGYNFVDHPSGNGSLQVQVPGGGWLDAKPPSTWMSQQYAGSWPDTDSAVGAALYHSDPKSYPAPAPGKDPYGDLDDSATPPGVSRGRGAPSDLDSLWQPRGRGKPSKPGRGAPAPTGRGAPQPSRGRGMGRGGPGYTPRRDKPDLSDDRQMSLFAMRAKYIKWCKVNQLKAASAKNLYWYTAQVSPKEQRALLANGEHDFDPRREDQIFAPARGHGWEHDSGPSGKPYVRPQNGPGRHLSPAQADIKDRANPDTPYRGGHGSGTIGIQGVRKGAPFAGYEDFDDCTSKNSDKDRPDAYCGEIKHRTEDKKQGRRKQAWSGWGPAQFPKTREVTGWKWDNHLNGYTSNKPQHFACECGDQFPTPSGFQRCACGRQWNSYVIGTGGNNREASAEKFLVREIPVRPDVIVANRRLAKTALTGPDSFGYYWDEQGNEFDPDSDEVASQAKGKSKYKVKRKPQQTHAATLVDPRTGRLHRLIDPGEVGEGEDPDHPTFKKPPADWAKRGDGAKWQPSAIGKGGGRR